MRTATEWRDDVVCACLRVNCSVFVLTATSQTVGCCLIENEGVIASEPISVNLSYLMHFSTRSLTKKIDLILVSTGSLSIGVMVSLPELIVRWRKYDVVLAPDGNTRFIWILLVKISVALSRYLQWFLPVFQIHLARLLNSCCPALFWLF